MLGATPATGCRAQQQEEERTMKITWLGHSGFRIETGGQVLLVDPWLRGNPSFDEAHFDRAIEGATHILITHGHGDHASTAPEIAKATGAPVIGIYDWVTWITEAEGLEGTGMNKGGTVTLGAVKATMVNAVHSSSVAGPGGQPVYAGAEAGFVIQSGETVLYVAGDTDVFADMALIHELHRPTHGILPIGGHFTMDAERAAFAARKFFDFRGVIPCHYATFPLLAPSADDFARRMEPTPVMAPGVMESVTL
jgi:L-ascorbate metabolism protein UlaG (beta-lactamase superfamily)